MTAGSILDVLAHIQSNLEGDLSLEPLAKIAGFSPGHFHRIFARYVGETPRNYVERVRLERAAFRLQLHDDSILTIALDVGFANHETFSRAFRRQFSSSPRQFRKRRVLFDGAAARAASAEEPWQMSGTKPRRMKPIRIAYLRHVGEYGQVPPDLWTRLAKALHLAGIPNHGTRVGVGHDSPAVTAAPQLRFDAGIIIPDHNAPISGIGLQTLAGGPYALTTHVGPYATLPMAYPKIFGRSQGLDGYELIGLPAIEMYHEQQVDPERRVSYTDIYLPLREKGKL